MEELLPDIRNITLGGAEDEGLEVGDEAGEASDQMSNCRVGKFLNDRPVKFVEMRNRLADIWQPGKGITLKNIGEEPYKLWYSDLVMISEEMHFFNPEWEMKSEQMDRLNIIMEDVMEEFGPRGSGLLTVKGIPNSALLQRSLLLLSHQLALLTPETRDPILKEHGLGSDVALKNPARPVSSFVMQLELAEASMADSRGRGTDLSSKNMGGIFKELGGCMMELGLRLARVCDRAIGAPVLEQSILESSSAKGRLIHYHSSLQNSTPSLSQGLWQQWHYDYGIFTVLTAPLFTPPGGSETAECWPEEGSCLQILHPGKGGVYPVKVEPGSFIVQVGEAAAILTKGRLCPTLHSVSRPGGGYRGMTRDTFAVFLQPAWSKILTISGGWSESRGGERVPDGIFREIDKTVPPLRSRLRDGMTFAEFSRQTTKLYYGGGGFQ